ncbi:MAG: transporter associated domain-containing protein [Nocardioides sp.]
MGGASLDDVEELTGARLEPGDCPETLAGYVMARLGRIPEVGDRVPAGDLVLEVTEMAGRRVTRVSFGRAAQTPG